jgi:hypothetical protein
MVAMRLLSPGLVVAIGALALLRPPLALAEEDDIEQAKLAEIDALRAEVASQIQLLAFDLLDDLVAGWTQNPVFATETPVVLASVTVPVGLGTGLEAMLENHFASLILHNPLARMTLVHCPQCTAIIVHSGAKGTLVSRGVDAPETLAAVAGPASSRYAVFLDFEAEGTALVLRSRLTAIEPALPIVDARTFSSTTSTGALLRDGDHLKSAAEARREYLEALAGRGNLSFPMRLVVRSYAASNHYDQANPAGMSVAPFVWLEAGVETAFTQAQAWLASFSLGYTWMQDLHDGWLAGARLARLISGRTRSLTQPDLYFFMGASVISIRGADAALFSTKPPALSDILAGNKNTKATHAFGAWKLGLELRVKNRIGASVFLETIPGLNSAPNLGDYLDVGVAKFQTLGAEVTFCF